MAGPKKHHYVPVFYQKHFADDHGLLWVYDRKLGTYKHLPPKVVCVEDDLYAVKPEGAPRDRRIESEYLSRIDALGASAIRTLDECRTKPGADVLHGLALFVAVQFTRLPSTGRAIAAMYERVAAEFLRIGFGTVERATALVERYARETNTTITVTPASMVEAVTRNHLSVTATERPFLFHLMSQAERLCDLIEHLDTQVLIAPRRTGFVICDNPVTIVPPQGSTDVGFGVPGAVKYLPLTRALCLRLGDHDYGFSYTNVTSDAVRLINLNIAANSERFIMGPVREQLQQVVERSSSAHLDDRSRFRSDAIEEIETGSLQQFARLPGRYYYRH